MKKIFETFRQKWTEYILEILVIMIGILGAFMLNDWNESNRLDNQRQELIASLIEDFEYNSTTLEEERIVMSKGRLTKMDLFYDLLNRDEKTVSMDSLRNLAVTFFRFDYFRPNLTAYNVAKSSGSLELLDNKKLLEKITLFNREHEILLMVQNQNGHSYYAGSGWEFRKTILPGVIYNSRYSGTYESNHTFDEYKLLMTSPLALNALHNFYVLEGNNQEQLSQMLVHSNEILEILRKMED
ncbi:MAG: hypothetical protein JXR07_00610 [Reichenbachiella sp.]